MAKATLLSPPVVLAIAVAAAATAVLAAAGLDRPRFVGSARVKQHFHKTGDLVEGEEHLLKVILKWDAIAGAEGYELCHNCSHIDEETGEEIPGAPMDGVIYPIEIGGRFVCGGNPCNVMPATARGHNKFHLRVKIGGEMSPWSNYQNFNVQEPGNFMHEEL